ncbi:MULTISPECIES: diacylglycerol kinase family protein [unclassified Haloarcula]|uniref:diacylglycerol/lipid kinase family protein n=1 Tax=unclassified Haloarcula TaxID=2624677 RepID=UPI0007BB5B9C|nr:MULTISPECIES: diacylglycerol kinase family protein [unclassified Haloarcula]KAA9407910.1 diacylglycerol kinase family lipid kinase [Haloarcula sp. CBA1131]KZX47988.1 diacylglycerol kinase [Haloarcula sp. K1]MUV50540.1 diacylglycerol kinase family lipid kinase [Haloarcula sp. CBA1122]
MQIGSRRCILNPVSGDGEHADYVPRLMAARGFEVYETEAAGDAVELGREAGRAEASEVAVCGGDGTVNEVIRGLDDAGHLDSVTLSVIPAGTANLLAGNIGVTDIEHGVEIADTGETRTVDVGVAGDEPFLVSCIAGLPADASVSTPGELKERFGTLAFLITGAQEALRFDGLDLTIEAVGEDGPFTWSGEATCLLVGNARKFVAEGGQANMEDGLLDVAIVEQMPTGNLVAEAIGQRLLALDTDGVTHVRADEISVSGDGDELTFSRDGELSTHETLSLSVRERALTLRVGAGYAPNPE